MLSVQRIAFVLALVVLASSLASGSECATWRSRFSSSRSGLKAKAQLMSISRGKRPKGRWSKKINGQNPKVIAPGLGACGDSFTDRNLVVLLWNGNKPDSNAGWGNGANTANCRRKVYIKANGYTVYALVEDFGTMGISPGDLGTPNSLDDGCSQVWATQAVFDELGATSQSLMSVVWDFEQSPVNQPQGLNGRFP